MTVPLSAVGSRLLEDVGRQMVSEGGWAGDPWAELSPEYAEWKERKVPGLPKLVGITRTGDIGQRPQTYKRSGKMAAELVAPQAVTVTKKSMIYHPFSEVAGYHEFGTEKMPARPPVAFPLTELREWDRIFVRWMNGLIVQTGLGA